MGNQIGGNAKVGPILVLDCGKFTLGEDCTISSFNVFKGVAHIQLDGKNFIGSWNQFTAAPGYQDYSDRIGMLWMKEQSFVTNRHYIDCSGQVILEPYAAVSGIKCIIQSHELDLVDNKTTVGRVVLGERSVISTACIMLKESRLPNRSILAAGSVMVKAKDNGEAPKSGLYGGAPARYIKELTDLQWWHRDSYHTPVTAFDEAKFRLAHCRPEAS